GGQRRDPRRLALARHRPPAGRHAAGRAPGYHQPLILSCSRCASSGTLNDPKLNHVIRHLIDTLQTVPTSTFVKIDHASESDVRKAPWSTTSRRCGGVAIILAAWLLSWLSGRD